MNVEITAPFNISGPFLTVNHSMFTEVEVANQCHCTAHR